MKNEELIERNIEILDGLLSNDFLKEQYFECSDNKQKEKIINLIKTQKSYLEKYAGDYKNYFTVDGITENIVGVWFFWVLVGVVALLAYLISFLTGLISISLKLILKIIGCGFLAPTVLCTLFSIIKGRSTYHDYLNNLNTKLEIIKNDKIEKGLIEDNPKVQDKKINDTFVRMIKETIARIKSLNYSGKELDIMKIKGISDEYFAILRKELALDSTTINLTTNGDIIALQNKLIEIENDAIAKAKIESDESLLASELGPLTTLDRRSVELDTYIDTGIDINLKRKLDK